MNLCFLVEGKRTEHKVYRKWVEHTFPSFTFVWADIKKVTDDCYCIIRRQGFPDVLESGIEDVLMEMKDNDNIDHLFICMDAENEGYNVRFAEIEEEIKNVENKIGANPRIKIHIIVQNCCIETWFLGHTKMLRRHPDSKQLSEFKLFFDVSIDNPEKMGCLKGYSTKAKFHKAYLKEMLRERNYKYSENHPGIVIKKEYLDALRERCESTNHLDSLNKLFTIWDGIEGN